ncbi:TPA: AAA family ATPase, partial [Vibrio cholerae]
MKLEAIKIKNFRTIDTELQVELQDGLTIVGPNSSGKTNILRAIEIFFTGFDNKYRYILSRDFPDKLDNGQTSL